MAELKYVSEYEARQLICEYGRMLYDRGLVDGNAGNISCRISSGEAVVTPTMQSKGRMTPDMLIRMDLEGNIIKGTHKPSSEIRMHLGVMKTDPRIGAVVHAHPPFATACAVAGDDVPATYMPEAAFFYGEKIRTVPFAMPGTDELAESVAPYCKEHRAVLLANHGALTWAGEMKDAFFFMETLEAYCRIYTYALKQLDGVKEIPAKYLEALLKDHQALMAR